MSTTVLEHAHHEWANRAPDERFGSLADIHAKAVDMRRTARVEMIKRDALQAVARDGNVMLDLSGDFSRSASLTNWSFSQLAQQAKAPPEYLSTLPAVLAAQNINSSLNRNIREEDRDKDAMVLLNDTGSGPPIARAITSDIYSRIWNADITSRLLELEAAGPWQPAPAAFDGSRGLYLSDRDMFAFLVDNNRRIFESDKNGGLSRGFFCWNSEVRASSFGLMAFLYEYCCGNHRVWGVTQIAEIRIIHIGKNSTQKALNLMKVEIDKYAEASAKSDEDRIRAAKTFEIADTKDGVVDRIFGLKVPGLGRKTIDASYDLAATRDDWYGSPRSAWGLAGGMTEIARDLPHANERHALDFAAAKVMALAA